MCSQMETLAVNELKDPLLWSQRVNIKNLNIYKIVSSDSTNLQDEDEQLIENFQNIQFSPSIIFQIWWMKVSGVLLLSKL